MQTQLPTTINNKEYVLVEKTTDQKDQKTFGPSPAASFLINALTSKGVGMRKGTMRGRKKGGKKGKGGAAVYRTKVVSNITSTSGSNAANSVALLLKPNDFTEITSLRIVFDEVKILGGVVKFDVYNNSGAAISSAAGLSAIGYSPSDPGNYSSAAAVCNLQQSLYFDYVGGQATTGGSQAVTKDGLFHFKFKIPKRGVSIDPQSVNQVAGAWCNILSTTASYGVIQLYVPATGTATVTQLSGIMELDVALRTRA